MKFGTVAISEALGAILAHSVRAGKLHLRKGCVLREKDIDALKTAGIKNLTVARLGKDDVSENDAAQYLARTLIDASSNSRLRLGAAFTGRVNIYATCAGLVKIDQTAIERFNSISPDITVATLPAFARAAAQDLVATLKIIPYGVTKTDMEKAAKKSGLGLADFKIKSASLILTKTPNMADNLLVKAEMVVKQRLQRLGCLLKQTLIVPHHTDALGQAIAGIDDELVLIMTGSATSDINDVGPAALRQAGGRITRFGMPVDPGNLLFLGEIAKIPVIGLPGCARSIALNGADFVLERVVCKLKITGKDIAKMGVGGLLKEIPSRPHPRNRAKPISTVQKTEVILLAAGGGSRMRGGDKLLEQVAGKPLLQHATLAALGAKVEQVHVVMQPENIRRMNAVAGLDANIVFSQNWQLGMAASIQAGFGAVSPDCDKVIIALADMPEITSDHFMRLIEAYRPEQNHEICRATTQAGQPGLPVLFGMRFFEALQALTGDRGARDIIKDNAAFVVNVPTLGMAAIVDLDTPEDWLNWRANRR